MLDQNENLTSPCDFQNSSSSCSNIHYDPTQSSMVSLMIHFVQVHSPVPAHYRHQCRPHLGEQLWSLWCMPHHSGALQWRREATSALPHLLVH